MARVFEKQTIRQGVTLNPCRKKMHAFLQFCPLALSMAENIRDGIWYNLSMLPARLVLKFGAYTLVFLAYVELNCDLKPLASRTS